MILEIATGSGFIGLNVIVKTSITGFENYALNEVVFLLTKCGGSEMDNTWVLVANVNAVCWYATKRPEKEVFILKGFTAYRVCELPVHLKNCL